MATSARGAQPGPRVVDQHAGAREPGGESARGGGRSREGRRGCSGRGPLGEPGAQSREVRLGGLDALALTQMRQQRRGLP